MRACATRLATMRCLQLTFRGCVNKGLVFEEFCQDSAGVQSVREEERAQREYAVAAVSSAHAGELERLRQDKEALATQVKSPLNAFLTTPLGSPKLPVVGPFCTAHLHQCAACGVFVSFKISITEQLSLFVFL